MNYAKLLLLIGLSLMIFPMLLIGILIVYKSIVYVLFYDGNILIKMMFWGSVIFSISIVVYAVNQMLYHYNVTFGDIWSWLND